MIRSRSDDIIQLLLLYFPYDICKIIINIMFQSEFNDSKEFHKNNCLYFNIQNKIGINLSSIKPPNPYHYRFNSDLWKHIDRDNKNIHLNLNIKNISRNILSGSIYSIFHRPIIFGLWNEWFSLVPEESYYHYDNTTGFYKSNEYISLKKFNYDMKYIFYVHDYNDQKRWDIYEMITTKYYQHYMKNRKSYKKKIYHKKQKNNFKFKGR